MREMKDSGVAWIGAVPSDFAISSIGSLFTIKKDIAGREPETVLSITQTGIKPKDLSSNELLLPSMKTLVKSMYSSQMCRHRLKNWKPTNRA